MASCSSCSVQKYIPDQRSKSCDTVCSSNSSCYLQRRKPSHPLSNCFRNSLARPAGNAVRQRVLSAKLLKLRTLQSQLNDANFHLAELTRENQALKTLQKRQDKALSKYEGANADLPRLLQAHEEEIRILTERNKTLRKTVKELNEQLKTREEELGNAKEQLRHLDKLNKDKHLGEREKLTEQVEDLKIRVKKYEDQISMLNRKIMLENKNFKHKLNSEIIKHKQCQRELSQALGEIDKLTRLLETLDRGNVSLNRRRDFRSPKRQSVSMLALTASKSYVDGEDSEKNSTDDLLEDSKDIKLEPIQHRKEENHKSAEHTTANGILKSPVDSIKARLSASAQRNVRSSESRSSTGTDYKSTTESESTNESRRDSITRNNVITSRPSSAQKLSKISSTLEATIQRALENGTNEFELRLGDYCSEVVNTVKNCSEVIESHKESLKDAKSDTECIMEALLQTETMEKQLKHGHLRSVDPNNITDDSLDLVQQILKDEMSFQNRNRKSTAAAGGGDERKKEKSRQTTGGEEKKKLLATLKAIDNGDSVESIDDRPIRKNKLLTELFGDIEL